jgi:hypothetical protein
MLAELALDLVHIKYAARESPATSEVEDPNRRSGDR